MEQVSAVNPAALKAVAHAFRERARVAVEVGAPGQKRVLFFDAGHLVAATSESFDDRLGQQLVREGRLDPSLLEPIQTAAKQAGRLFGNQLLADGLLRPDELAAALERQVVYRFNTALTLDGPVSVDPRAGPGAVVRQPIGALVIDLFRSASDALVASVTGRIDWRTVRLTTPLNDLDVLKLKPPELRVARMLGTGRAGEVPGAGPAALRLVAGLGALGLLALR